MEPSRETQCSPSGLCGKELTFSVLLLLLKQSLLVVGEMDTLKSRSLGLK